MEIPTLVISDPPQDEVDLEAAGRLLGLDVFATRLKAKFVAPEVLSVSRPDEAREFAAGLRDTGFVASILPGAALADVPWPDPVSTLAFDTSCMRTFIRNEVVEVGYDSDAVGVYCRPPEDLSSESTVDLKQAVASGHGPTIAEAIQWRGNLDLYFQDEGSVRRISIVPDLLQLDGEEMMKEVRRRFRSLRLDDRLAGLRPRARLRTADVPVDPNQRRGYSFGTPLLREALGSISRELTEVPQYELGSRLAYSLRPLEAAAGPR